MTSEGKPDDMFAGIDAEVADLVIAEAMEQATEDEEADS